MINMQDVKSLWENEVCSDYRNGLILNERTMQAVLYKHITQKMGVNTCLEPHMPTAKRDGARAIPDIVVYGDEIDLIAELKFVPHGNPIFESDVEKFCTLMERGSKKHLITLDPKTGKYARTPHYITNQTRFAFFVVGHSDARAIIPEAVRQHASPSSVTNRLSIFYGCVGKKKDTAFGSSLSKI